MIFNPSFSCDSARLARSAPSGSAATSWLSGFATVWEFAEKKESKADAVAQRSFHSFRSVLQVFFSGTFGLRPREIIQGIRRLKSGRRSFFVRVCPTTIRRIRKFSGKRAGNSATSWFLFTFTPSDEEFLGYGEPLAMVREIDITCYRKCGVMSALTE